MSKILIADDDELVLRSLALVVGKVLRHQTVTVSAASDILEAVRRERPDVVLQDASMPGLDLPELLAALRTDPSLWAPAVIVVTGYPAASLELRLGVCAVLQKPFATPALGEAIERAVGGASSGQRSKV